MTNDNDKSPFSPIKIGPLELRNRLIRTGAFEGRIINGLPSKSMSAYHGEMAAGGVGLTTVAYCAISRDGRTFPNQIVLSPESVPHMRAVADAVHRAGGAISAQITHSGSYNFLPRLEDTRFPRTSTTGFYEEGFLGGRPFKVAMTSSDMEKTADRFASGAQLAREAGFDAVEIHMGHGYLLSQFLSPAINHRRDSFGGADPADRVRFPAMVLRRVLDAVGRDLAVTCKVASYEGCKGGTTGEDAAEIVKVLEAEGAHLIVLTGGLNKQSVWVMFGSKFPFAEMRLQAKGFRRLAFARLDRQQPQDLKFREMYLLEHSRKVRAAVKLPLAYLGGVRSLDNVKQLMDEGFECVAMARPLVHDLAFVNKLRDGSISCSGCDSRNECVTNMHGPAGTQCVLTPRDDLDLNRVPAGD